MPEEIERCRRAGCDDFLTKPIKEGVLFSKVCELLKVSNRHAIRLLIRVEKSEGKEVSFGSSRDISKTGMQLEVGSALQIGEEVTLRFFLKNDQEEMILNGKIVRGEQGENSFRYGIQFVSVSLAQKRALMQFLESRASR
jgi:c-di-GMP-binding flagellar brake protein YcgR